MWGVVDDSAEEPLHILAAPGILLKIPISQRQIPF